MTHERTNGNTIREYPTDNTSRRIKDEEYLEKVFLKEAEYVDLACLEICIGYEEVYIKDGVIVS